MIPDEEKQRRYKASRDQWPEAHALAWENGMSLVRFTDEHYQLKHKEHGWLNNIYPGNCRLYWDRNHSKPPFFDLPFGWSVLDVVRAAVDYYKDNA